MNYAHFFVFKSYGFSGDGGQATTAEFEGPIGVAIDTFGNIYVSDDDNNRVRMVNTLGVVNKRLVIVR